MALITSHTLNGIDGTHASYIRVQLVELDNTEGPIFDTHIDSEGRLSQAVSPKDINPLNSYDLVFFTGHYWESRMVKMEKDNISEQIVVRFRMPDPEGHYHVPVILNPKSYTVWLSR